MGDLEKAILHLESLFDRIESNDVDGKWRIAGPISAQEREAIKVVLIHLGGSVEEDELPPNIKSPPNAPAVLPEISLNVHSTALQTAEDQEVIMCLDFGTAMSKAFAMHSQDETPIDLAIGRRAGYTEAVYPLPSSVFISANGKMYFGHEAISRSLEEADSGRKRFDSPKQELSQGEMTDLSAVPVGPEFNPTKYPFTKDELITLYLAYLTDMACSELSERHSLSRYVRRRFARPCWDIVRTAWAERLLSNMLARAQIVADTFSGQWSGGINVEPLRAAFNKLGDYPVPSVLIAEGIAEPVAAAASRVVQGEHQRLGFMVVDVGAGTTDFGMFVISEIPDRQISKVFQIPHSIRGVRHAGDTIDAFLRAHILKKHDVDWQGEYGQRISNDLGLRIRQMKEALFRDKKLRYSLRDDISGELDLPEFLNSKPVERFSQSLEDVFGEIMNAIHESYATKLIARQNLTVVLTGGGSRLPMVEQLATGIVEAHGVKIIRTAPSNLVPEWIDTDYSEYRDAYAQMAVAIGGAAPNLPEMGPETPVFGGGDPPSSVRAGNLQISGT